jgi:CHAT domain-containing protein
LQRVEEEYQRCLEQVRGYDPEFQPDAPVSPISIAQALALLPNDVPTALVQYTLTRDRGLALIVTGGEVLPVDLPELNDQQGWELAEAWYQSYFRRHERAEGRDLTLSAEEAAFRAARGWEESVPDLLRPVAQRAVYPVVEALAGRGIARLVLVPNRALHVFPLHACQLADGRYLADAFEIGYTPSLSILHRCAQRRRPASRRLFLAENPTEDLPFTALEAAVLRRLYPEHTALTGHAVTRQRLLTDATSSQVLHYSGHAYFDTKDPLRSALILEKNDEACRDRWLSLRDVFAELHLRHNVLTVISGCESGMVKPDRVDEYVGLPSGFLFAGATCVLSTLWAIHDLSSALLMQRFHQHWLAGQGIAAALRQAQRWLRDIPSGVHVRDHLLPDLLQGVTDEDIRARCRRWADWLAASHPDRPPFGSPVHWAPFVATGLSYPLAKRAE